MRNRRCHLKRLIPVLAINFGLYLIHGVNS